MSSVKAAAAEYDRLGERRFLATYRYGTNWTIALIIDGREYPAKAIFGRAHGYLHPPRERLRAEEVSAGETTLAKHALRLGFTTASRSSRPTGRVPGRTYGEIPGVPVGTEFPSREALFLAGVHRQRIAGISGGVDGADSIVVSGGYIDDEDHGAYVIYTGQGGNDPVTKRQIADQQLTRGNVGLARSELDGRPVRLIRGADGDPEYSPARGYRYDGLYRVDSHWQDVGRDGFRIWRYRLDQVESTLSTIDSPQVLPTYPTRQPAMVQRIVRNTAIAQQVKEWHHYCCQICGLALDTAAGPYAEGAHIRGLGRPHNGPDTADNVLCLCPNHHVLFDAGGLVLTDELYVEYLVTGESSTPLRTNPQHRVNLNHVQYHRDRHTTGQVS